MYKSHAAIILRWVYECSCIVFRVMAFRPIRGAARNWSYDNITCCTTVLLADLRSNVFFQASNSTSGNGQLGCLVGKLSLCQFHVTFGLAQWLGESLALRAFACELCFVHSAPGSQLGHVACLTYQTVNVLLAAWYKHTQTLLLTKRWISLIHQFTNTHLTLGRFSYPHW